MQNLTLYLKSSAGFKDNLPRSDTIFGAVCWGIWFLYGEKELSNFLDCYQARKPAMLLSSLFPFIETNKGELHLFPKPKSQPILPQDDIENYKLAKRFNKVLYVDDQLFQEILHNHYDDQILWEKLLKKEVNLSGDDKILSKEAIRILPVKSDIIPGNAVDRLRGGTIDGKLYHTTEWFLMEKVGVFLLLKISSEWFKQVVAVFRFYGDKGLGGDSSVGKGNYFLEVKNGFPIQEPKDGERWLTLSLYYPTEEEWLFYQNNSEKVWYSVIKRKGKIESGFTNVTDTWKKSVLLMEEGSSFPVIEGKEFYGILPLVKEMPNKLNILQYGLGFPIKMR